MESMGSFPTHKYEKEKGGETIMSAFMVADKTINRVITWLEKEVSKSLWLNAKLEKETGIDTAKPDWQTELGNV
jgi:hypothetical protein